MRPRGTELIPSEPFARWLDERVAYWERRVEDPGRHITFGDELSPLAQVLNEVGWPLTETGIRRLHRMRRQLNETSRGQCKRKGIKGTRVVAHTDWYTRSVVEEALHRAGVRLGELYPYEALVDEFAMEYLVPRDQATQLADSWVEGTWRTVWEKVGLFVSEEDRPKCYCRTCKRTTRLFMGTCDSCGEAHPSSMVAAVARVTLTHEGTMTGEMLAQARWLREQYQMPYRQIAVVMAVYHGLARDESVWRRALRGAARSLPSKVSA